MPSIQKRKVSVAEELASIEARLTKAETLRNTGMTNLSDTNGTAIGPLAYSLGALVTGATSHPITLVRPVPLLITAQVATHCPTPGTATFVQLALGMQFTAHTWSPSIAAVPVNVSPSTYGNGSVVASIDGATWTVLQSAFQAAWPAEKLFPATVHFFFAYSMIGGAATTLTVDAFQIDVFSLGG